MRIFYSLYFLCKHKTLSMVMLIFYLHDSRLHDNRSKKESKEMCAYAAYFHSAINTMLLRYDHVPIWKWFYNIIYRNRDEIVVCVHETSTNFGIDLPQRLPADARECEVNFDIFCRFVEYIEIAFTVTKSIKAAVIMVVLWLSRMIYRRRLWLLERM